MFFFFFNDPAPPEIYPLSLPDALPILLSLLSLYCSGSSSASASTAKDAANHAAWRSCSDPAAISHASGWRADRKSTRLNSSHLVISYAVFCLKKKKIHL